MTSLAARAPHQGAHARDGIRAPRCVTAPSAGVQRHRRRLAADAVTVTRSSCSVRRDSSMHNREPGAVRRVLGCARPTDRGDLDAMPRLPRQTPGRLPGARSEPKHSSSCWMEPLARRGGRDPARENGLRRRRSALGSRHRVRSRGGSIAWSEPGRRAQAAPGRSDRPDRRPGLVRTQQHRTVFVLVVDGRREHWRPVPPGPPSRQDRPGGGRPPGSPPLPKRPRCRLCEHRHGQPSPSRLGGTVLAVPAASG